MQGDERRPGDETGHLASELEAGGAVVLAVHDKCGRLDLGEQEFMQLGLDCYVVPL